MALICLTFLVFLSIGIFSLLNSTSRNLNDSYDSLVQTGQLNDFVVNEKYDYGKMEFSGYVKNKQDPSKEDELEFDSANGTTVITPSVSRGDEVIIKLDLDSYNSITSLVQQDSDYQKYFDGILLDWTNFNPSTDKVADYIYATLQNMHNEFFNSVSSNPNFKVTGLLDKLDTTYRNYQAINITDGNIKKKVVDSNHDDAINKLVVYSGTNLSQNNTALFNEFATIHSAIATIGKPALKQPKDHDINPLVLSEFLNALQANTTELKIKTALEDGVTALKETGAWTNETHVDNAWVLFNPNRSTFINDGWGFTISWDQTNSIRVIDFTSYEAIVAPGNWKYEEASGKKIYTDINHWNKIKTLPTSEANKAFEDISDEYKIKIGNVKYLIMGVGITPDFMYPVFDFNSLVPNPQSEYLYYANASGYNRIRGSFLTNPVEVSIVGKFPANTSQEKQREIIDAINDWSVKYMSWPNNVKAAYFGNDTTNYLNLNAVRTAFIPTLINTISNISFFLTLVIAGLALFVGTLIIKNYITKNRFSLAVLQANGVNKWRINASILLFSIIPSSIGGLIGYFSGFILQDTVLNIFSNYWYIPTQVLAFNFSVMLFCIVLPAFIFCLASLIIGYMVLRQNVVKSLNNDSDYKVSRFSLIMKAPLRHFSVTSRFRAALAFNSFWKLIILSGLSAATMVVFNFTLATIGQFEDAENRTKQTFNYGYAVDLATPTEQSGLIKYQEFKKLGTSEPHILGIDSSYFLANRSSKVSNWGSQTNKDQKFDWDNIHVVSFNDSIDQTSDIMYLENLVQSKIMLDYTIKAAGISVNPWTLSASLMPANQLSASDAAYDNFLLTIIKNPINGQQQDDNKYILKDDGTGSYSINNKEAINTNIFTIPSEGVLKKDYLNWLNNKLNLIRDSSSVGQPDVDYYDYKITYNLIGLDNSVIGEAKGNGLGSPDYAYTRIDAENDRSENLSILGIKDWIQEDGIVPDNYLGPVLRDENKKIINHDLFAATNVINPIIVNQYTATKYQLQPGSAIKLKVTNRYDRITNKLSNQPTIQEETFTVIGINNSAKDDELYISYENANKILGFSNDQINRQLPFNGYFTNSLTSFERSTPLFSMSGLFPGTSSFSSQNVVMKNLVTNTIKKYMNNPTNSENTRNYQALLKALGKERLAIEEADEYLNLLNTTYDGLPFNSMISYIDNVSANEALFTSLSTTTLTLINVIIGIIVPIVILVVILISNMLIDDLRKIGIRLKALGYSDIRILGYFLSIYIPVFIIGLIVSIPFSQIFISNYNWTIFTSSNIVLSTALAPMTVFISFISLLLTFALSFISNAYSLRKLRISEEIKNY